MPVTALFFLIKYTVQDRGDDRPNGPWFMVKVSMTQPSSSQIQQEDQQKLKKRIALFSFLFTLGLP